MVKPFLRYVLSSGVACVGFGLALHGGDARALVVNVGGSNYDVTTISGTYDSLLPTLSTQPWFGNSTLAASFRNAVWDGMGLPNLGLYGPAFATRADLDEFEGSYYSIVSVYQLGDGTFDNYPLTTTDTNFIYAQA